MFMRLMNEVLKPILGKFVVLHLVGILVYRKGKEDHIERLRLVDTLTKKFIW